MVLTSHDTRDIELVCERVIVINSGRIVLDQPTDQLRRRFLARKLVTLQSQPRRRGDRHARRHPAAERAAHWRCSRSTPARLASRR